MSKYFEESEFVCEGEVVYHKMNKLFLKKLNLARMYSDTTFVINSSWRSVNHNMEVGGSATSSHLHGLAVDIRATTSRDKFNIIQALLKANFNRIGVSDGFIHVDNSKSKEQYVIFTY